jgi:hypothetical protein
LLLQTKVAKHGLGKVELCAHVLTPPSLSSHISTKFPELRRQGTQLLVNNVGQDHKDKPGIAVDVGSDGINAHVSEGALALLGDAVAWLAPKHSAKGKITAALAARVATKLKSGDALDDEEQYFVSLMFQKEARKLAHQEAVAHRVVEVMPDVKDRVKPLLPYKDRGTSRFFLGRAETIAGDITDDTLRDLFAQVLAGELCRPGSFSMRTLDTIPLLLDPEVTSSFDFLRGLSFNIQTESRDTEWGAGWIWDRDPLENALKRAGMGKGAIADLAEAGLVGTTNVMPTRLPNDSVLRYGDQLLRIQPATGVEKVNYETISGTRLTRSGREIASVLAQRLDAQYFVDAGQWLSNLLGASAVVECRREPSKDWIAIPVSKKS